MTQYSQQRELPAGWVLAALADVCAVNPRTFIKAVTDECPVSFVPMAAVEAGTGLLDATQVRKYGEVRKGYTRFSEGDVLFAKITPCMENGKIAIAKGLSNGSGCGSTEFHVIRPPDGLSNEYLAYFLLREEFRKEAQRHMAGTAGQLRVPPSFLSDTSFPLPPLPEQRRIVAEIETQFTRLDASVAALRRTQANLKRYRASTLRAACSGELVPTEAELARAEGREYEPAGVLLERILVERRACWEAQEKRRGKYKEPAAPDTSDLPTLPEGWVWATVGQAIMSSPQNGLYKPKSDYGEGIPILRISDYQDFELSDRKQLNRLHVSADEINTYGLAIDDLVVNRVNSPSHLGKSLVIPQHILPAVFESNMMRLIVNDCVSPKFVSCYLRSIDGRNRLLANAKWAVNQASINQTDVCITPIPLPPLAEQQRIVAEVERRLSVIQQAEAAVEASLQRAERLRQSILKRAFAGELVPQDPNDEPASVLLERIRAGREADQAVASAGRRRPARRRAKAAR